MKRKTAVWLEDKSWHRVRNEMLLSPAWNAAKPKTIKLIMRLLAELGEHGGMNNGNLICTKRKFEAAGLHPRDIGPAILEAHALGFVAYKKGRAGTKGYGKAHRFRLTFLPILDPDGREIEAPTDEWARFDTTEATKLAIQRAENRQKSSKLVPTVDPRNLGTNGGPKYLRNQLPVAALKPNEINKGMGPTVDPISTSSLPVTPCSTTRLRWSTPTLTEVLDPAEAAAIRAACRLRAVA